jgi:hypothetical protein
MWIITTWQCISPEVIVKGFKKCCISSVLKECDGDMFVYNSNKDGNVWSECEVYEGTECEGGGRDTDW